MPAKNTTCNIPFSYLRKTQGVSRETAIKLAKGVRKKFKSDIGVAIVGFAGPRAKKGIKKGTSHISVAQKYSNLSKKITIKGNRDTVRKKASYAAMRLLHESIIQA